MQNHFLLCSCRKRFSFVCINFNLSAHITNAFLQRNLSFIMLHLFFQLRFYIYLHFKSPTAGLLNSLSALYLSFEPFLNSPYDQLASVKQFAYSLCRTLCRDFADHYDEMFLIEQSWHRLALSRIISWRKQYRTSILASQDVVTTLNCTASLFCISCLDIIVSTLVLHSLTVLQLVWINELNDGLFDFWKCRGVETYVLPGKENLYQEAYRIMGLVRTKDLAKKSYVCYSPIQSLCRRTRNAPSSEVRQLPYDSLQKLRSMKYIRADRINFISNQKYASLLQVFGCQTTTT